MPNHVTDSMIFRDLYGTPEMRAIFDDAHLVQRWLDVEAALARAQAGLGIIPEAAAVEIEAPISPLTAGPGGSLVTTLDNGLVVGILPEPGSAVFGLHLLVADRSLREAAASPGAADLLHRCIIQIAFIDKLLYEFAETSPEFLITCNRATLNHRQTIRCVSNILIILV